MASSLVHFHSFFGVRAPDKLSTRSELMLCVCELRRDCRAQHS